MRNSGIQSAPSSCNYHPEAESPDDQLYKTEQFVGGLAGDACRAFSQLFPFQQPRLHPLPDKTVASQVLMYRQLLHTKCKPALKLSRKFQGTKAQTTVMHMPWWEQGMEETKQMSISYDNLITRLWLNGAIHPLWKNIKKEVKSAKPNRIASAPVSAPFMAADLVADMNNNNNNNNAMASNNHKTPVRKHTTCSDPETLITEEGLPPVPHKYWVDRLGFQQPDPVTDFRSGGVLSLALMVYMVESHPEICERFFFGDASVLPFAITCINVTDMIAKFLMLSKTTNQSDALLSQKPFWRMFGDPNAILAVQSLAMNMLADVVVELGQERQIPSLAQQHSIHHGDHLNKSKVTVFDFSTILERTEGRVRDDLLGAGPQTVAELYSIADRLRRDYQYQLERKIQRAQ